MLKFLGRRRDGGGGEIVHVARIPGIENTLNLFVYAFKIIF
jgi:hypothetical protein